MAQSNFTLGAVDIIARHGGAKSQTSQPVPVP